MNEYPSVSELKELEVLAGGEGLTTGAKKVPPPVNIDGLINRLEEMWSDHGRIASTGGEGGEWTLELHTGGWSGNEEIIDMLQDTYFWFFYWQKSKRGGHDYFGTGATPPPKPSGTMERALELACEFIRGCPWHHNTGSFCPITYAEAKKCTRRKLSDCWKDYFISKAQQEEGK